MLLALNVFVSMMSAPASRYARWIFSMASGCVSDEQVVAPFQRHLMVGEAFAAELALAKAERLDDGPHGAVEDQNPVVEQAGQECRWFAVECRSPCESSSLFAAPGCGAAVFNALLDKPAVASQCPSSMPTGWSRRSAQFYLTYTDRQGRRPEDLAGEGRLRQRIVP